MKRFFLGLITGIALSSLVAAFYAVHIHRELEQRNRELEGANRALDEAKRETQAVLDFIENKVFAAARP